MFASNIWIRCSDMHDMFNINSGEIINNSADVVIEPHVWVAQESLILKGSKIGCGSILGARSLISGKVPAFSLVVGSPAKVIKQNVSWYRNRAKSEQEKINLFVEQKKQT